MSKLGEGLFYNTSKKIRAFLYPTSGKESINYFIDRGWRTDQPARKIFLIGPVVAEILKVTTRWQTRV